MLKPSMSHNLLNVHIRCIAALTQAIGVSFLLVVTIATHLPLQQVKLQSLNHLLAPNGIIVKPTPVQLQHNK